MLILHAWTSDGMQCPSTAFYNAWAAFDTYFDILIHEPTVHLALVDENGMVMAATSQEKWAGRA